ncbi:CHC2 zinc finger domain-containing protein [Aureispira anguillae]|uniref:CHC2 zinc finger domain-containing protein n=1 Tax=Aureispira anguillae TaxID=2864201 RepID=A0A915YGL1_9BACT|nr:CHC2 zinc finger domain-containing protein [Aureispira anguillae]BDS12763.1 CHC2 zinc finger domain-containing protein [Aureispira anguillae]
MYIQNIASLKSEFKIETVVKAYYPAWDGRSKLSCPFHEEKTPSFSISIPKNIASCFGGCGTYDPIGFVKQEENCSFIEAVIKCAKLHGLEVRYNQKISPEQRQKQKEKQNKQLSLLHTNKLVAKAYFDQAYIEKVPESVAFKNDGQVRILGKKTVEKFQVCTTPEQWDFLQKKTFDPLTLLALDLIAPREQGGYYDVFRAKQLFPIHGRNNQIVGFAGRQLIRNKKYPKYRNSKETSIYRKKEVLYGLYPQGSSIRKQGIAYLAEGYWDVLTPYDRGFKGICATCGTALNERQAQLLKRFAPRVCYLADNDSDKKENAGLKAVRSGLPILIKAQLHVDVVIFPAGEDPDSYMRLVDLEKFEEYIQHHRKDAVLWYVEDAYEQSSKDAFDSANIAEDIIDTIKHIQNENLIDIYCTKIPKLLKLKVSTFRMQLSNAKNELLKSCSEDGDLENGLNKDQRLSLMKYGIYEMNNQLMCSRVDESHVAVSNFIVKPLFHLSSKENPKRLFEIINRQGQRRILDTETANLVSLEKFKNVVESQGNFVFSGNAIQYNRLKRKVYDMMQTCYEVDTLGYHNDGFYTFGNGIYTSNKGFIASDRYGVLEYAGKQYFLPAFSDIYKDSEMLYDEEKNFIYKKSVLSFKDWAALFCRVHGTHGQIALCFYLTALFRSHILKYAKVPLLNLFGMPETGKSLLAENLICMFGSKPLGLNIHSGTKVSMNNKLMVVRDGLVLFEEYKNSIDVPKCETLKSTFDNTGRERGQKSTTKNLKTKIYSTAVLVGQELPTADVALFTRCITLSFSKTKYSQAEKNLAEQLKSLRGSLSGITAELSTLRPIIEERFLDNYNQLFAELRNHCQSEGVSSRMIENNSILLAVYESLKDSLEFPFSRDAIFHNCADNLFEQNRQISNENEVSVFWSLVEYLAVSQYLKHGEDYLIKQGSKEHPSKLLLYISFSKAYPLYREKHHSQYGKQGLNRTSLLHYLRSHHTFIAAKKAVRFGKKNTSAFVFDYEKLGLNLMEEPEPAKTISLSEQEWAAASQQVNQFKKQKGRRS